MSKLLKEIDHQRYDEIYDIAQFLSDNRSDKKFQLVLVTNQAGERSGLAATYPLYDAVQKVPHKSGELNIYECVIALTYAIVDLQPNIHPNPARPSNVISISRIIRKQSKRSYFSYKELEEIKIDPKQSSTFLEALTQYEKVTEHANPSDLTIELKSLIKFFQASILNHKSKLNNEVSPESVVKNKEITTSQFLEQLSAKAKTDIKPDGHKIIKISPSNNQAKVNFKGTIQEDNIDSSEVTENTLIEGEARSNSGNRVAAKASQLKGAKQAQFSRYRWERLNPVEKNLLLAEAISSNELQTLSLVLTLITGSEPLIWGSFSLENHNDQTGYIDFKNQVWGHSIELHKNSWAASIDQRSLIDEAGSFISLPLSPFVVEKAISLGLNIGARTLSEALKKTPDELQLGLTQWLLNFQPRNREITVAKLREELYSSIMDQTMDQVAAHMICAQPTFQLPIQLFYTAFTNNELNIIYKNALDKVLSENLKTSLFPNCLLGSKLQVKRSILVEFIQHLKKQLRKENTTDYVDFHNNFTLYSYVLLSYATGHRLVIDPFSKGLDFIENINGVVIYDKETDINHTGRISILGKIGWAQYEHYRAHLLKLSNKIYSENPGLRSQILDCLDGKETLPFLFLLERDGKSVKHISINEISLSKIIPDWQLPLNTHRHYLSTNLRRLGASAELIDYQLGHFQNGTKALGITSTFSLNAFSEKLTPAIDSLLSSIEFEAIPSEIRAKEINSKRLKVPKVTLGYKARLLKRRDRQKRSHLVIKDELNKLTIQLLGLNPLRDDFDEAGNHLIQSSLETILMHKHVFDRGRTLAFFYKILNRFIKSNRLKLKVNSSFSKLTPDPSPISPNTGERYKKLSVIRSVFLNMLSSILEKNVTLEAKIGISLLIEVIFGYLHNSLWIKNYYLSFKEGLSFETSKVLLDLKYSDKNTTVFRYEFSRINCLFLLARKDELSSLSEAVNQKSIVNTCNEILKSLPLPRDLNNLSLDQALMYGQSASLIELPGVLSAICTGKTKSYSINKERYLSIVSNSSANIRRVEAGKGKRDLNSTSQAYFSKEASYKSTKEAQKYVRQILSNSLASKQDGSQKKRLEKAIELTFSQKNDLYPIYHYILEWGRYLLNGTLTNRRRRAKTINQKMHSNSNGLLETFVNLDPLRFSEAEFIDAYNNVIQFYPSFKDETQQVINHLLDLQEFHTFLINSFGVPEIDFSDLDLPESISSYLVDANLISTAEYRTILDALKTDTFVSNSQREYQSFAFCLAFNFGLRSNELFTLLVKDIQIIESPNFLGVLNVQANRYGILKTNASKRSFPLEIWLDDDEINLIKKFLKLRRDQGATDDSPLFSRYDQSIIVDVLDIKTRIIQVMRYLTGDSSLKFHHLRHSFANWMREGLIKNSDSDTNQLDTKITAIRTNFDFSYSRRALFQLAEFMGHAHPTTTVLNYVHNFDEWLWSYNKGSNYNHNQLIQYDLLSSLINMPNNTIRQWKSRDKKKQGLLEVIEQKLFSKISVISTSDSAIRLTLPDTVKAKPHLISFEQLTWFIIRYTHIKDSENISKLLFCERSDIDELVKALKRVGEISGYIPRPVSELFSQFDGTNDSNVDIDSYLQTVPRQDVDLKWIARLEKLIIENRCDDEVLGQALSLWVKYVHPSETCWKFEKGNQFELFSQALQLTGIDLNLMELRNYGETGGYPAKVKGLPVINYSGNHKSKEAKSYFGFNSEKMDLELVALTDRKTSMVRTMNFFLFLATVIRVSKNELSLP
jgi:integrase